MHVFKQPLCLPMFLLVSLEVNNSLGTRRKKVKQKKLLEAALIELVCQSLGMRRIEKEQHVSTGQQRRLPYMFQYK